MNGYCVIIWKRTWVRSPNWTPVTRILIANTLLGKTECSVCRVLQWSAALHVFCPSQPLQNEQEYLLAVSSHEHAAWQAKCTSSPPTHPHWVFAETVLCSVPAPSLQVFARADVTVPGQHRAAFTLFIGATSCPSTALTACINPSVWSLYSNMSISNCPEINPPFSLAKYTWSYASHRIRKLFLATVPLIWLKAQCNATLITLLMSWELSSREVKDSQLLRGASWRCESSALSNKTTTKQCWSIWFSYCLYWYWGLIIPCDDTRLNNFLPIILA